MDAQATGRGLLVDFLCPSDLASQVRETSDATGDGATFFFSCATRDGVVFGQTLRGIASGKATVDRCSTGATAWFGGRNLASFVLENWGADPNEAVVTSVLELGCGLGLAGLAAAAVIGAAGVVVLTDGDGETIARAAANASADVNQVTARAHVFTAQLCFGDLVAARSLRAVHTSALGFSMVLAADCIYEVDASGAAWQADPLFRSAATLLAPGGRLMLAVARRFVDVDQVCLAASSAGFGAGRTVAGHCFDLFGNTLAIEEGASLTELAVMWQHALLSFELLHVSS